MKFGIFYELQLPRPWEAHSEYNLFQNALSQVELADRCGADGLVQHVRSELYATGARPRTAERSGPGALTPSERRVAELAAAGRTNKEIAQALFVTLKTVEVHLSSSYQKLGIGSRRELEVALAG